MALMSYREGFGYDTDLQSDVAPIWEIVETALNTGGVTSMKDPTRGGLANALNEISNKSGLGLLIEEDKIPLKEPVIAVSEMLGIDPYEVANEGKVIMGVDDNLAEETIKGYKED